jgi:hypothetical protein
MEPFLSNLPRGHGTVATFGRSCVDFPEVCRDENRKRRELLVYLTKGSGNEYNVKLCSYGRKKIGETKEKGSWEKKRQKEHERVNFKGSGTSYLKTSYL